MVKGRRIEEISRPRKVTNHDLSEQSQQEIQSAQLQLEKFIFAVESCNNDISNRNSTN
jgi:hypothetical protein